MLSFIKNHQTCNVLLIITGIYLLGGCSGSSVFVPSPQGASQKKETVAVEKPAEKESVTPHKPGIKEEEASPDDELDFALAFADTLNEEKPEPAKTPLLPEVEAGKALKKETGKSVTAPSARVRVALFQNIGRIAMYSLDTVDIRHRYREQDLSCRGRISVSESKMKGNIPSAVLELSSSKRFTVFLPCTLLAHSTQNYFELDECSYRGSIILAAGKEGSFSVINYCPVEEYLRGVVPLEIGKRPEGDMEAVKAQAVAARTYTYKKMTLNSVKQFDLVATVEDQVYGGVNAENPMSDRAIRLTENRVMVYGDSLIYAYYHSTCGGVTAYINDVWNKEPLPYLKPMRDVDKNGKVFCSISHFFTWKETWSTATLSSIAQRYSRTEFPGLSPLKGGIKKISIKDRYRCGRVSSCRITTSEGAYEYKGDKIRFVLRRNIAGHPVLRSLHFEVVGVDSKYVKIIGRGYGHGVGMCQMGAIGRARSGQSFEEILKAYYSGVDIVTIATPGTGID